MATLYLILFLVLWNVCLGIDASGKFRCDSMTETAAKCTSLNLTFVPQSLPDTLEVFDLSYNNLTILHNESFEKYNLIRILNISHNFIHAIESGSFGNLCRLEKLVLKNNAINEISENLFINNTNISTLILSYNKLWKIPHLNGFCNNNRCKGATGVVCTHLHLTSVNQSLPNTLEVLDLSYNKITVLHNESFQKYHLLRILNIAHNSINVIEGNTFGNLPRLEKVILDNNVISEVPPSLFINNPNISTLILAHNNIRRIPHLNGLCLNKTPKGFTGISELRNLTLIDFSYNNLTSVEGKDFASFSNCSIHEFKLGYNELTSLPKRVFNKFSSVGTFDGRHVNLSKFEVSSFLGIKSMIEMTLERSQINCLVPLNDSTRIHRDQLPKIKKLQLRLNKIEEVPHYAFLAFEYLQVLDLSVNRINYISNKSFCNMTMQNELNLSQNKLIGLL
nr:asporin-like [Lytechinus pictus]